MARMQESVPSLKALGPEPEQAEGLIAQAGRPTSTQLANMTEQREEELFILVRQGRTVAVVAAVVALWGHEIFA